MRMIDFDRLAQQALQDPRVHARNAFGAPGVAMVTRLVDGVRSIFEVLSPESLVNGITVISPQQPDQVPECASGLDCQEVMSIHDMPGEFRQSLTAVVLEGGKLHASGQVLPVDAAAASDAVYSFHPDHGEAIHVADREFVPDNPTDSLSAFAVPTFSSLESALARYAADFARFGELGEIRNVWRDQKRLMFRRRPEETMRRALETHLVSSLRETRDIEVRPESNVDESHPVDIRVSFTNNRVAIIEIKWMGNSADDNGGRHVIYRDARAKEGATQLADYLDKNKARATGQQVTGYLVILDARRQRINPTVTSISETHGMHYRDKPVEFAQELLDRADFAEPVRMFMEPVYT